MKKDHKEVIILSTIFILSIVAANVMFSTFGIESEMLITMFIVPIDFVIRDKLNKKLSITYITPLIIVGSTLSYILSDPQIAIISGTAFGMSLTLDYLTYNLLQNRISNRVARLSSNVVASVSDTLVFAMGTALYPYYASSTIYKILGSVIYDRILYGNAKYEKNEKQILKLVETNMTTVKYIGMKFPRSTVEKITTILYNYRQQYHKCQGVREPDAAMSCKEEADNELICHISNLSELERQYLESVRTWNLSTLWTDNVDRVYNENFS